MSAATHVSPGIRHWDRIRFRRPRGSRREDGTAICHRLRFPNDDTLQILALVANHMKFKDVGQMRKSTLKRFVRLPAFPDTWSYTVSIACPATVASKPTRHLKHFLAETPARAS